MNESNKLQEQKTALLDAKIYLQSQRPRDKVVINEVSNNIFALEKRQSALTGSPIIPDLTDAQVKKLQAAIGELHNQIAASATADEILDAATAILKSVP